MISLDEFVGKYTDKPIDYDHVYGNQCVDLVAQYCVEVLGIPPYFDDAADWWYNHDDTARFTKVANTPKAVPQKGDIVIWDHDQPGSGGSGHIDIWLSGDVNNFTGFDQNWPIGSFCHKQSHNYNNVVGWLRPKNNPQGDTMPQEQDVKNLLGEIWGKAPDAQTVKNCSKMTWHDFVYYAVSAYPWTNRKNYWSTLEKTNEELRKQLDAANGQFTDAGTVDGKPVYRKK